MCIDTFTDVHVYGDKSGEVQIPLGVSPCVSANLIIRSCIHAQFRSDNNVKTM